MQLLLHHHGLGEIVKIERTLLINIKDHMELVIRALDRYIVAVSSPDDKNTLRLLQPEIALCVELGHRCWQIMRRVGLSNYLHFDNFLFSSKLLSKTLDIGLVAYVGSHGSRFDLNYLDRDLSPIMFDARIKFETGVIFGMQKLACLNEFMDNEEVWMFNQSIFGLDSQTIQHDLSLLTDMECFADLWGPVWTIPAGDGFLGYIQYYVTSKGIIRRVPHGTTKQISFDDKHASYAKMCHWYSREAASQLELGNVRIFSEDVDEEGR